MDQYPKEKKSVSVSESEIVWKSFLVEKGNYLEKNSIFSAFSSLMADPKFLLLFCDDQ